MVAQKSGVTAFVGRSGGTRHHSYEAHPRLYVSGAITAPDHSREQERKVVAI